VSQPYPFTRDFELAVLRQVVADPMVLPRLGGHVEAERFPSDDVRLAFEAVLGYWKRLGRPPTSVAVVQEARGWQEAGKRDAAAVQRVASTLDEAAEGTPADSAYVVEQVSLEARKVAVWGALDQGLRLHGQGRLDEVEKVVVEANRIGRVDMDVGVDWAGSLADRTDARKNRPTPKRWGTGVVELDDLLRGGLSAGELGVVVAAPGAGKSTFLVTVASHVMNLGGTVVYYSFEMNEVDLVDRIDSAVTSVPMDELPRRADHVQREVAAWLERCKGACVVKKFPARVTSAREVRAHLEHLRADKGICPTVLVFDYADKMASSDGARYEKDHQIVGAVYDEIRNLGAEFSCPVWTASQTNAEGDEAKVASGHHIARSREKWANADVMISINRTDDEKANEQVRFHIIKARYTADGVTVGPLRSDYARGRVVPLTRRAA
jgi:replicative DNA helicase